MKFKRLPCRVWVAVMVFFGTFENYMFRSHFQFSLLAMVVPRGNETTRDYGPRYNWSLSEEQNCIAAASYGLTLTSLPSGMLSELIGPWHVLFWSSIGMACLSIAIVPLAGWCGWVGVFVMRFIIGMLLALQYPAMQCLIGRWAPPKEKGKFIACLMGNVFGTMVTMPLTSFVIVGIGWDWSYYYLAFVVLLYCLGLFFFVADYPRNYRWMGEEELRYIEESHAGTVHIGKKVPPYLAMIMSIPFWAAVVSQFGNQFGLFMNIYALPSFLKRVLDMNLKSSAAIAALPSLARLLSGFLFGFLNDLLIHKGIKKIYCRKGFTVFSHILSGVMWCVIYLMGTSKILITFAIVMVMVFNGAAVVTTLINAQDLTPNFAGSVYGIMNFFGGTSGFMIPIMVSSLTTDENLMSDWALVFCIGGGVLIVTGILFIIFGSVKVQWWNEKKPPPEAEAVNEQDKQTNA